MAANLRVVAGKKRVHDEVKIKEEPGQKKQAIEIKKEIDLDEDPDILTAEIIFRKITGNWLFELKKVFL